MANTTEVATALLYLEASSLVRQGGREQSDDLRRMQLAVWQEQFADVSGDVLLAACKEHVRRSRYFPAPADLFEILRELVKSQDISAEEAWALLGRGRLDAHPLLPLALQTFGPERFRGRLTADEGINLAQFGRIWATLQSRARFLAEAHPAILELAASLKPRVTEPRSVGTLMAQWASQKTRGELPAPTNPQGGAR